MRPPAKKRPTHYDNFRYETPLSRRETSTIALMVVGAVIVFVIGAITIIDSALTWAESFYVGGL